MSGSSYTKSIPLYSPSVSLPESPCIFSSVVTARPISILMPFILTTSKSLPLLCHINKPPTIRKADAILIKIMYL